MNVVTATGRRLETSLYVAVKSYLETIGYEAKGEIYGCDIVGIRPGELPIVVITERHGGASTQMLLDLARQSKA